MSLRRLAPALLVPLAASCAGAPPRPPDPPRSEGPPAAPVVAAPLPAHWIAAGGATAIGPTLPAGTLVLLGGRRALVHADGALEGEKTPAPEPLTEIVEVPAATGDGVQIVARGAHGVYRLDDPLGAPVALARSRERLVRLGAGPGIVAVWTASSDLPRFLDVGSGHEASLPGLPAPPLLALGFLDRRRGAAVLEAVGLAITTDGGATWRPAAASAAGDALRMNGIRRRAGHLHAYAYADGPDAAIDLDAARLGPLETPRPPPGEPRMLRWIRVTGRDPLEAAAAGGLDLPGGAEALVVSHGLLARVDPRSGAVAEIADLARSKWVGPCGAGRAGRTAYVACALGEDTRGDLFDPFGVVKVPLAEKGLAAEAPALVRNGEAELRVSPSGGALLMAPCTSVDMGSACVRQPDGHWTTVTIDGELTERGAGPLADGRLAFLRGLTDGDDGPPAAHTAAADGTDPEPRVRGLHVVIAGADGKEHALGAIAFTPSRGYVRVQSPIEEDLDHTLRFVVEDGDGPFSVVVSPGKDGAQARRIPDAVAARLRGGRGIAVGEGRVLASLDGGATWSPVPAPPAALEAATLAAASYDEPGQLEVSEVGAKIGPALRLGWSPPAPPDTETPEPTRDAAPAPLLPGAPASLPEAQLTCATLSTVPTTGVAPLSDNKDIRTLLAGKPPTSPAVRHETGVWWSSRSGMLDPIALLDEEGPSSQGAAPAKWTFRWHDPQEIGGRVRSVTIPAPAGATWGPSLRFAAASGARAMFVVRSGGKLRFVRVRPSGAAEVVEGPIDLLPTEVSFGEGRSEAIAWARETTVVAWLPGDRPRPVARLSAHAVRTIGAPGAAGIPVLLGGADWSLFRTLPIPANGAPIPSIDGWTRLPSLHHPSALPACAPGAPPGTRFSRTGSAIHAEIDGARETSGQAIYDLRVEGSSVCVAGLSATLAPERGGGRTAPPAKGAKPAGEPPAFVRVDLVGKRAEGGPRGLPPAPIARLRCALGQGSGRDPLPR